MTTLVSARLIGQIPPMQTAEKSEFVSVADYLAAEQTSDVRHEYLRGLVYAMAGETRTHNTIALNLAVALRQHLKAKLCRLYMSDVRVNFDLRHDEYYYYPDLVVTCDKRDTDQRFIHYPKLIIEVLSKSTERIDKREKFLAYTSVESLQEYVLVPQASRDITVFRRDKNWKAEIITAPRTMLTLESLGLKLPLSAIYEGV